MASGQIVIEAELHAAPAGAEALADLLRRTQAASRAEDGCVAYRFTRDLDDPHLFYAFEIWDSEAALLAHGAGAPFRAFLAGLKTCGELVSSRRWIGVLEPWTPRRPGGAAA